MSNVPPKVQEALNFYVWIGSRLNENIELLLDSASNINIPDEQLAHKSQVASQTQICKG